ncbi:hypothetical protein B0H13DRAFT_2681440 [Mycena leptocephala]|nr:hypothetical protein B0H13DRAFT_2681440 [Mycena leptocephala]
MLPSLRHLSVSLSDPLRHLLAKPSYPIDAVLPFPTLILRLSKIDFRPLHGFRRPHQPPPTSSILAYLLLRPSAERGQVTATLVDALTISRSPSDLCPNLTSILYGISGKIFDQTPSSPWRGPESIRIITAPGRFPPL